jgi:SAM-dependent methyltransferase
MHAAVGEWVARHAPECAGDVVDVGGRDINGTVRAIFADARSYLSVDPIDGPGVDVAVPFEEWDGEADTVVCCEVAEHCEHWELLVEHAFDVLRPGGVFIFTAAGPGRGRHSAIDESPIREWEWYENVEPGVLEAVMTDAGFVGVVVDVAGSDVRAVGVKEVDV